MVPLVSHGNENSDAGRVLTGTLEDQCQRRNGKIISIAVYRSAVAGICKVDDGALSQEDNSLYVAVANEHYTDTHFSYPNQSLQEICTNLVQGKIIDSIVNEEYGIYAGICKRNIKSNHKKVTF